MVASQTSSSAIVVFVLTIYFLCAHVISDALSSLSILTLLSAGDVVKQQKYGRIVYNSIIVLNSV